MKVILKGDRGEGTEEKFSPVDGSLAAFSGVK